MHGSSSGTGIPATQASVVDASDAGLVSQAAGGDLRAFEMLYRGYFPRLTRFLNGMTRSVQLIEEIVNDTMLVVWQKSRTFDGTCKVSTWIFAIAYRKARKAICSLDEPVEADFDLVEGGAGSEPEHELNLHELQRAVGAALDALPPRQRAVIHLVYHHGMGYVEIADIMDCPVNTVKTRMFHARRRLKDLLAGQLEETA